MSNTQARPIADPYNPKPESTPTNPLIEGVEKLDDWLEHREIVVQELCPVEALETLYAQRAALYLWRIDRVTRFEIDAKFGAIEAGSTATYDDSANAQEHRVSTDPSTLQTIIKYETHLQRCLAGTMAELRRLQKERRLGLRNVHVEKVEESDRSTATDSLSEVPEIAELHPATHNLAAETPIVTGPEDVDVSVQAVVAQIEVPQAPTPICVDESTSRSNRSVKSHSHVHQNSHSKKHSARRNASRSQRASPAPKIPPLLDAISRRRRLCEYIAGESFAFERNLNSATLDFSVGRCP